MTTLQTMIQDLCTAGANPQATIQTSLKETGKPAVGCFPLFVPEELVYAAGFLPVGMWGGISAFQKSNQYIQSFACSIMRANLELGMSGAYDFLKAALIPSQCDTLKCVCENFKVAVPKVPVIGVTIPQNRTIQAASCWMSLTILPRPWPKSRLRTASPCPWKRPSPSMRTTVPP